MDKRGIVKIRRYRGDQLVSERCTDFSPLPDPLPVKEQERRTKRLLYIIREVHGWVIGLVVACAAIMAIYYLNIGYIQAMAWVSTIRAEVSRSLRRKPMTGLSPKVFSEAWRFRSSLFLLLIYDAPLS